MAEARLQMELAETKAELQRLRERVSIGAHAVHKDLSLISLVPKWSGSESGIPLEEFISSIEGAASLWLLEDSDRLQVAILRLSDAAKQLYNGSFGTTFTGRYLANFQGSIEATVSRHPHRPISFHAVTNGQAGQERIAPEFC